jgi:lactoylglutathione lyase
MPRIDHVAMWTSDLEGLATFYAQFFGASIGPKYTNAAKGFESRFLSFENGARIELMQTSSFEPVRLERGSQRSGLTHLAMALESEGRVDELTATLRSAGFEVVDGPRRTGDGYYESVVLDPDGNRIELAASKSRSTNEGFEPP